jgi:hypothetical protein
MRYDGIKRYRAQGVHTPNPDLDHETNTQLSGGTGCASRTWREGDPPLLGDPHVTPERPGGGRSNLPFFSLSRTCKFVIGKLCGNCGRKKGLGVSKF